MPRTTLQLTLGQRYIKHLSFLVADEYFAPEDIFIGLPVWKHLLIDIRAVLVANQTQPDSAESIAVGRTTKQRGCKIGRLMTVLTERTCRKLFRARDDYPQRSHPPD